MMETELSPTSALFVDLSDVGGSRASCTSYRVRLGFLLMTTALTCMYDGRAGASQSASYYYDGAGRLIGSVDPINGSAVYHYDQVGNILSVSQSPIGSLVALQVSPSSGITGNTIIISGTGFVSGGTTVNVGGKAASITAETSTSITTTIPAGATSGPVTVTTGAGTVSSVATLTVGVAAPTITVPANTTVSGGGTLAVAATLVPAATALNSVFLNGRPIQVVNRIPGQLTVALPPVIGSGPLTLRTPSGSYTSANNLLVQPHICFHSQSIFYATSCASEPLSSASQVTLPGPGSSVAVNTSISTAGDVSEVLFYGVKGQRVAFLTGSSSFSGPGGAGGTVFMLNPDGLQTSVTSTGDLSLLTATQNYVPTQTLSETGVYALVFVPGGSATGTVTGTLYNVAPDLVGPISPTGTSITETVTSPGQAVDLSFSGTLGQRMSLYVTQAASLGEFDYYVPLEVLASNGVPQYQNGLGYPLGTVFSGAFALNQPGTTTYSISNAPPVGQTGTIAFTLWNVPPDVTGSILANGVAANPMVLTAPGQQGAYSYAASAASVVDVATSLTGSFTGVCPVTIDLTPTGTLTSILGTNALFSDSCSSEFDLSPRTTISQLGTYSLALAPGGAPAQTGTATMTMYTVKDVTTTVAPNSVSHSFTTNTPNQYVNATISNATTSTVVAIQATFNVPGYYPFDALQVFSPLSAQTPVYSTSYDGNPLTFYSSNIALKDSASGSYTIRLSPGNLGQGTETLTVFPVTTVAGTILSIGNTLSLTGANPAENYQATYVTPSSSAQTVTVAAQTSFALGTISVYQGATQLYLATPSSTSFTSTALTLSANSTYTILAIPASPVSGTTTFSINNAAGQLPSSLVSDGSSRSFNVDGNGALRASFFGAKGDRLSLLTDNASNVDHTEPHCFSISIKAPDGKENVYQSQESCGSDFSGLLSTEPNMLSNGLPEAGTYEVVYQPLDAQPTNPRLTLYRVPPDIATVIAPDHPMQPLATTVPGQGITAQFQADATGIQHLYLQKNFETPERQCARIAILDHSGGVVRGQLACDKVTAIGPLRLTKGASYTAVVRPSGGTIGSYSLSVGN